MKSKKIILFIKERMVNLFKRRCFILKPIDLEERKRW